MARTALAAVTCLALTGCNTANTPVPSRAGTTLGPARCPTGMVAGGGSASQLTAFEEVVPAYQKRCDYRAAVEFKAMSADDALIAFGAEKIDWIATDAALGEPARSTAATRCGTGPLLTLPTLADPIVLPYHLPDVDRLVLSGAVAGRILDGTITTWNHPDIAALNPGVPLPDAQIVVVGRADAAGATEAVSRYLAAVGAWPEDRVGTAWAGAGERQDGSAGIARAVRSTPNSIGYAELSVARENSLPMAWLDNGAGPVEPTVASAGRALSGATVAGNGGDLTVTTKLTDTDAGAYPLISVGHQLTCQSGFGTDKAPLLRDFLGFLVSEPQQQSLGELGLVPLPTTVTDQVTEAISQIR